MNAILRVTLYDMYLFLVLALLLLQSGDIELNPDPRNAVYDLSILHFNRRILRNKIEFTDDNFDVLCFTEIHFGFK